jgi:hypothetical protein
MPAIARVIKTMVALVVVAEVQQRFARAIGNSLRHENDVVIAVEADILAEQIEVVRVRLEGKYFPLRAHESGEE